MNVALGHEEVNTRIRDGEKSEKKQLRMQKLRIMMEKNMVKKNEVR